MFEGLLVIIACHGLEGGVLFGSDGKKLNLVELQWAVNGLTAAKLVNKPKIFIVNSCRGKEVLTGFDKDIREEYDGKKEYTNQGADFYTARSNLEGYKAIRTQEHGTYFLQAVAYIWRENLSFRWQSLVSVMCKVQKRLKNEHNAKQVMETSGTLEATIIDGKYVPVDSKGEEIIPYPPPAVLRAQAAARPDPLN